MRTLKESIISSNNASSIGLVKTALKNGDCRELNRLWKVFHLDVPDYAWIMVAGLTNVCKYANLETPSTSTLIRNYIMPSDSSFLEFSGYCDKSYEEKVAKTLKLEKDKRRNEYHIK